MTGFYLMHRGWMDNKMFASVKRDPFCKRAAWAWLIERAGFNGDQRGHLSYSVRYLAEAWGWPSTTVFRFLKACVSEHMIECSSGTAQIEITICNYNKYQSPSNDTGTTTGVPVEQRRNDSGTNIKEGKEGNKEEESPDGDSMPACASLVVKKGAGNGRRKPRQAFPADWFPSERGIEFAHGHGRDDAWIAREGPRCRENHISKGNLFADLDAAWRTWVLGAERFDLGGGGSGPRSGSGGPGTSRIAAALNKVHLAPDLSGLH